MILVIPAKAMEVEREEEPKIVDTCVEISNAESGRTRVKILGKEKTIDNFLAEQSENIIVTSHQSKITGMTKMEVERIKTGILKNIMEIEILMGMTWYDDALDRRIEDQKTEEIEL